MRGVLRKLGAGAVVVGAVLALVTFAPASAQADTVVPPGAPVNEVPWKSSTLAGQMGGSVGAGAPLTDEQKAARTARYAMYDGQKGSVTTPWTPETAPQPSTPKKTTSRIAGGGALLGTILMVPWLVQEGTHLGLRIAGVARESPVAGQTPDQIVCSSFGSTADNWLMAQVYGSVDCRAIVGAPDEDVPSVVSMDYATIHVQLTGGSGFRSGSNPNWWCYGGTAFIVPSGTHIQMQNDPTDSGAPSAWVNGTNVQDAVPFAACPGGAAWMLQAAYGSYVKSPVFRVAADGTNAVVATAQTTKTAPLRQSLCTVTFSDGTTATSNGAAYHDADGFPTPRAGCTEAAATQPGKTPTNATVKSTANGTTTTIADMPISAPPSTTGSQPGRGLVLTKTTGTTVANCLTWEANCAGWWAASSSGTDTSTYNCTFQGDAVALAECVVYKTTFDGGQTSTPSITDPVTGEQVQWSSGTNTNSMSPEALPGDTCMAQWSSAPNPVEWVFWPVKCALVWAFVPRASKMADLESGIQDDWTGSYPGKLGASVAGLGAAFTGLSDGSCGGLVVPVPGMDGGGHLTTTDRAFLAACPGDFFAPWAPVFKVLIGASIVIIGLFAARDQLDRFVGNGN